MTDIKTKTTRVLISMKEALLELIDENAKATAKSRSEFIRDSVRFYIQNGNHLELNANTQPSEAVEG